MGITFQHFQENHHLFFDILPQDWQDEIVPHWNRYKEFSDIYVLIENDEIIGGGITFSTCPPDIDYYRNESQQWFEEGYLYLGFIWIAEEKRNMNLGSLWLDELKKHYPNQSYWLLIEEEHLHRFYQKNDFVLMKTIVHDHNPEWLYAFKPLSS